jgi:hemerythrin
MDKLFKKEVLATELEAVDKEHEMIHVILDKIKYVYAGDMYEGLKKSFIKELYQFLDFHFTSKKNLLAWRYLITQNTNAIKLSMMVCDTNWLKS